MSATTRATSARPPGGTGTTSSTSTTASRRLRALHDRGDGALGPRVRPRRLPLRRRGLRADRLLGERARRARCGQAGVHAGRVGGAGPPPRGLRHDLRLELEPGPARDRPRQGQRRAAADLLLLGRQGLPAGQHPHDVRQQPRQERLGGHRVRAVRRRLGRSDRAVGGRQGNAADLQRPGGRQRPAAVVLRPRSDPTGSSTRCETSTAGWSPCAATHQRCGAVPGARP